MTLLERSKQIGESILQVSSIQFLPFLSLLQFFPFRLLLIFFFTEQTNSPSKDWQPNLRGRNDSRFFKFWCWKWRRWCIHEIHQVGLESLFWNKFFSFMTPKLRQTTGWGLVLSCIVRTRQVVVHSKCTTRSQTRSPRIKPSDSSIQVNQTIFQFVFLTFCWGLKRWNRSLWRTQQFCNPRFWRYLLSFLAWTHFLEADGILWPTREHYFQGQKLPLDRRSEILKMNPNQARKFCNKYLDESNTIVQWQDKKDGVMTDALRFCFQQNKEFRGLLESTKGILIFLFYFRSFFFYFFPEEGQNERKKENEVLKQEFSWNFSYPSV